MSVYTGGVLSGSTNGKPISVAATATPGTAIHTVASGTSGFDEIFLFASNTSALPATLTIEWGGTTDPSELLVKSFVLPANSIPYPISAGLRIQNGLTIRAFSATASVINITGWFNRVS